MSNYKGHLVGGCVAYALVWYLFKETNPSFITSAEWLLCALMGSLFPDVDIKSKGQRYFYTFLFFSYVLLLLQQKLALLGFLSIFSFAPLLTPHRGLFHHIGFVVGMPVGIWALVSLLYPCYKIALLYDVIFFISGQLSHLWLDMGIRRIVYQIVGQPKKNKR